MACSPSSGPSVQSDPVTNTALKEKMAQSQVSCGSSDCPGFVAALFIIDEDDLGPFISACSATLIKNNRLLTNAHCLPKKLKQPGASCLGDIKVFFPESGGYQKESIDCDHILALSDDTAEEVEPDWAILKLAQKSLRPVVQTNKAGVGVGAPIHLYPVDFDLEAKGGPRGVITQRDCVANSNHFKSLENIGPQSALFNFSQCSGRIHPGHSGSGVLNDNNELIGVLSFSRLVEESNAVWAQTLREQFPDIKQNFGGGTNLACIQALQKKSVSPLCSFPSTQDYKSLAQVYAELLQQHKNQSSYRQALEQALNDLQTIKQQPSHKSQFNARFVHFSQQSRPIEDALMSSWSGAEQPLYRKLYAQALAQLYPIWPLCIDRRAPSSFTMSLPSLIPYMIELNQKDGTQTRSTHVQMNRFIFQKSGEHFELKANQDSVLPWEMAQALKIKSSQSFLIPVCD